MNYENQQPQTQPQAYVQPNIQPPNTATFNLDTKTREILSSIHPELLNAFVNIAIKKFSTSTEFINYYVRDEFKQQAEVAQEAQITQEVPESQPAAQPAQAAANNAMDFTSW